jgi:hypothetical protein
MIRISDGRRRHDRIAVEHNGRWLVPACRLTSAGGELYPWSQVVDDVRTAIFVDTATGPVLAVRYVRHKGGFEPHGVGPDGNGDGPNVREHGTYEDHLVEVDLTTLSCSDAMLVDEQQPDRIVPYGARGMPAFGSVPNAWRKNALIKPGPFGGAILE